MDTVARIGGDEFTIILSEAGSPTDVENLAEKIIAALSAPFSVEQFTGLEIGVSIGIATYPESGTELDTLVDAADRAMYESKIMGRNNYTISNGSPDRSGPFRPWITLDESLLLNYPAIDEQHQVIAALINDLNAAVRSKQPPHALTELFEKAVQFVADHFDSEEGLMEKYHYPAQKATATRTRRCLTKLMQFVRSFPKVVSCGRSKH
jgi:hemerythrin-like metal-binding protein